MEGIREGEGRERTEETHPLLSSSRKSHRFNTSRFSLRFGMASFKHICRLNFEIAYFTSQYQVNITALSCMLRSQALLPDVNHSNVDRDGEEES